jgi:ketosteroid isomerase-like protein
MRERNLETVRAAIQMFNEIDIDAGRRLLAPEVVMHAPDGWPEPGPEHGVDAVIQQFERLAADWESFAISVLSEETGDGVVVARLSWETKSLASDVPLQVEVSGVYWLTDGRITELRFFWNHDQALDAAGLRR